MSDWKADPKVREAWLDIQAAVVAWNVGTNEAKLMQNLCAAVASSGSPPHGIVSEIASIRKAINRAASGSPPFKSEGAHMPVHASTLEWLDQTIRDQQDGFKGEMGEGGSMQLKDHITENLTHLNHIRNALRATIPIPAASSSPPSPDDVPYERIRFFAQLGDITRSTPTSGYGVKYIAARKHWHITLNGVDQSHMEPCFNEVNDALDRADVLNGASSGSTGAQSLAQPTPEDTKRLDHLEAWLDGFEFVHLPTQIEPEVRCDWFAGDGSGHWFTQGKTFREAIDKSLNHEATQESHD